MKKIYHLGKCTTCQRIIKELGINTKNFEMQEIRSQKITPAQLDGMKKMAGSYETLFSRIAIAYKTRGLKNKKLGEKDYRRLILEEDTFLKRPVIIIGDKIFVGNSKNVIASAKAMLKQ